MFPEQISNDFIIVSDSAYKDISTQKSPQGILAVMHSKENSIVNIFDKEHWTIYLDRIQDPGNMGTIIRTAEWFGVKNIVASSGCVDFYNPESYQCYHG